ncbi:MAG: PD-(D/E)XK nuclease family protein, partial [Gemmatimonadaceae bacterium]
RGVKVFLNLEAGVTRGPLGVEGWAALDRALVGERTHARVTRLRQALGWAAEGFAALSRAEDAARLARAMAKELRLTSNLYFARRPALGAAGGADGASDGPRLRALTELAIREDNEAWEAIDDALDSVPSLLEMQGAPRALRGLRLAHAWRATLERALQARSVSGRFARRDAVRVGGSGAGACQPARVTIVLGLIEKLFPRQPRQDPFLRDDARRLLREEHGWQLPLSDEMMDEERACFLRAAASATDALYLACPATDAEGRQAVKSFFLEDLRRALDAPVEVERVGVSDLTPALGDAATPAELMATVSHDIWQHLPAGARFDTRRATAAAAYDTLRARRSDSDLDLAALTGARRPVMRPRFSRELFAGAPHETLLLSASQLGALGHCTYKHYVDKVLGPVPFVAPEHDPLDRGSLVHAAIVRWSLEFGGWQGGDEAAARADVWLSEEVGKWPPAKARSFRAKHEANRMREQLAELLGHERGLLAPSMARPEYSELAFGEELRESGLRDPASVTEMFDLPVRTATGELVVHLRGSIDRVDIIERGGRRYGVAYDYKTGKSSKYHARAMWQGHDLQLRLYLLALEHFWGVVPVGALYLGFGDRVRRGSVHADFADAIPGIASAPEKEVRRLDATAWEGFVRETPALIGQLVDRLVQLDIVAEPRDGDCGFCELGAVCRFDPHGLEMVDA